MQGTKNNLQYPTHFQDPLLGSDHERSSEYPTKNQFETACKFVPIFQVICFY